MYIIDLEYDNVLDNVLANHHNHHNHHNHFNHVGYQNYYAYPHLNAYDRFNNCTNIQNCIYLSGGFGDDFWVLLGVLFIIGCLYGWRCSSSKFVKPVKYKCINNNENIANEDNACGEYSVTDEKSVNGDVKNYKISEIKLVKGEIV